MKTSVIHLTIRSPLQFFMVPLLAYCVLWLVAPLDFVFAGNAWSILLLMLYTSLFSLGLLLGFRSWRSVAVTWTVDLLRLRRFALLLAVVGTAGLLLHLYEHVFLRAGGSVDALDFIVNREAFAGGGVPALSFVGSVLGSCLMLLAPVVLLLFAADRYRKRYWGMLALSLTYPASDLLLQGSLSTLLMSAALLAVGMFSLGDFRIRLRSLLMGGGICFVLVWLASAVFVLRTSQLGINPVSSMSISAYARFAPPSPAVLEALKQNGASFASGLLYAYVHIFQYFLHGLYEFFFVAANVATPTTYGLQSFYIPSKAVATLLGHGNIETLIAARVLRPGVYTTLFGPLLYDFGRWGAALACFIFAFGAGSVARMVRRGHVSLLLLYFVVVGFLPFSFVLNLYTSGTGQSLLLASIAFAFVRASRRFRVMPPKALGLAPATVLLRDRRAGQI